jgi:hypothetical protein
MRPLVLTLLTAGLLAATLPARDGLGDDRRPARWANDPERRPRLQQYLAAFRRLSPEMQAKVRQLDKALYEDEDAVTRARLLGVAERYAGWLSRLPESDRGRVNAAPAGPERLRVVREVLERQWIDGQPPAYRERLASAAPAERTRLLDKWRSDEQERQRERVLALRVAEEAALPIMPERQRKFREEVQKFVKEQLEPKLNARQKERLATAAVKNPAFGYFHQVLLLSELYKLKPPGPPEVWERFREPRSRPAKLPE